MLLKALEEAGKAPDPIAALEMALVRLCAAQTLPPPEDAARLLRDGAPAPTVASPNRSTERAPAPAPQASATTPFQNFEDVTRAVAEERDIELELALDRLKVTRFSSHGEIVFIATPDQPRDLVRRLKAFLEERTPFEWLIRSTEESSAPVESLEERRKRERQREMEDLKRQPFVAEALKAFPDAQITAVWQPAEATPGDVVALPAQAPKPTPQSSRKKEADR
jgi:DNA polymerase-3 subunit gamma/tau